MPEASNPSTSSTSDDDAIIFEITIIDIALALGAGFLVSEIVSSDDDSGSGDSSYPVLTLNGPNPAIVELGSTYVDAGATADKGVVSVVSNNVDTSKTGTYTVGYSARDSQGRTSFIYRTVVVIDSTAPVITILGDNPATVELGSTYTDAGATASDLSGTVTVTSTGTVDTSTVGTYTITYSATDASGNTGTATRTVNVVDTTAHVITVLGDNPATVELGSTYTDAGATADGGETVTTGTVDTSTVGTYTITYSATDASGNTGTATRTVNVVDTTAPVITVLGDNPATVELGSTYTDAGATADGGETVTSTGTVDTSTVGTYTITYSATDASGNTGTATRTVNVVDTTAPVITVLGDNPATVTQNTTYIDAGATADGGETVTSTGTVDTALQLEHIPLPIQQLMLLVIQVLQLELLMLLKMMMTMGLELAQELAQEQVLVLAQVLELALEHNHTNK